jgi:hypothetical protein
MKISTNRKYLKTIVSFILMLCIIMTSSPVISQAKTKVKVMTAKGVAVKANKATVRITFDNDFSFTGVQLLRYDDKSKEYVSVKYVKLVDDSSWWMVYNSRSSYDWTTDKRTADITDPEKLEANKTYKYEVRAYYKDYNGKKVYVQTIKNISVKVKGEGTKITKAKRLGTNKISLSWNKVSGADGYLIYCAKDHDSNGEKQDIDFSDLSNYKCLKNITNRKTTSYTVAGRKHGYTYGFVIYAYKKVNGKKMVTIPSKVKTVTMDYYGYEDESTDSKYTRAFGGKNYDAAYKNFEKQFDSYAHASAQMTTISIKVWDFANGKNGAKITKTMYLTVNKRLAPTIKKMFEEIYNGKEKTPIHSLGGFSYETFDPLLPKHQHLVGLAIDINAEENCMMDGDVVSAGSFWDPKKSGYSIPLDCELVRIMRKYGFERGLWSTRKDYMHFSYFGT